MVKQGGNDQIKRFFRKLEIENSPIQTLYCSKGANHYRERLKERVAKILSGEIKSEPRHVTSHHIHRTAKSQSAMGEVGRNDPSRRRRPSVQVYSVSFNEGPMGMTISKDFGGRALVSRLVPCGPAETSGVAVGDHISGIARKRLDSYDEIMHMIPCMTRPLVIQFTRTITNGHHQSAHSSLPPRLSGDNGIEAETASPGKNRSIHGSKSMANLSLGLHTGSAVVNGYHNPKVRSPRPPSIALSNINEGRDDETAEDTGAPLRLPSGLTKLKSFRGRSQSKDSADGAPINETLTLDMAPVIPVVGDVEGRQQFNGAESTLTDERQTPPSASSPPPGANGARDEVAELLSPSLAISTPEFSTHSQTSPSPRPLSVQSEPSISKTDLCREIDELLDTGVGATPDVPVVRVASGDYVPEGSPDGKCLDQHRHVLMESECSSKKLTLQVRSHTLWTY
jgi:hypothetical protein